MWPLGLSHNRLGSGKDSGWARQQNKDNLPSATAMAGVDMRLAPGAYRELHWHTANEWSLVLKGSVRLSAVNENGETFLDDISAGDVWFFPAGVPHSIQALDEGTEFLLVFDNGDFNEDSTFLASELFLRNPKSVLSKDLQTPISSFDHLPTDQLYLRIRRFLTRHQIRHTYLLIHSPNCANRTNQPLDIQWHSSPSQYL